jgi:hypothetical protein
MSSNKNWNPYRSTGTRTNMHTVLNEIRAKQTVTMPEVVAMFTAAGAKTKGSAAAAASNILSPRKDDIGSTLAKGHAYYMEVIPSKTKNEAGVILKRGCKYRFHIRKEPIGGINPDGSKVGETQEATQNAPEAKKATKPTKKPSKSKKATPQPSNEPSTPSEPEAQAQPEAKPEEESVPA